MEKDEAIEVAEKLSNVNNENYYVIKSCFGYGVLNEEKFKKAKKESYHKAIPSL